MAKMVSISGAVVGKIGGNVYSINAGQQLVRVYQPNVANPSTEMQVSNRSKFKLASQLAAAVSPVLAISKQGMVTGRNQFVSATMGAITENQGEAQVALTQLQLTKSSIELPLLIASRGEGTQITCALGTNAVALGVTKVVYALFIESAANKLQLIESAVESNAGSSGHFDHIFASSSNSAVLCYAYGIIESENSILAKYGNYEVNGAGFIASLISSRSKESTGLKTTTTRYANVTAQS